MAKLIGVYGGSFNPPHIGHVEAAKSAVRQLCLEKVLFIPAGIPPHKSLPEDSPSGEMRAQLLHLALGSFKKAEVLDLELNNERPSYTADTLRRLKNDMPGCEFIFLMGSDMFLTLEKWFDSGWILSNVGIGVFSRAAGDMSDVGRYADDLRNRYGAKIHFIDNKVHEISSTDLRELLRNRKGFEYLSPAEYAAIIKNRIYAAKPNFDWLREVSYKMHKVKRIPHVTGTEQEAEKLALHYGEDAEDAKTAAILHDITKKLELSQQLILCERYGIMVDNAERRSEKLLHSKTGAYLSREEFGVSDRVFDAILWHTTGRAGMSLLEKIIYLADYIEPTRKFDGLEELRSLAYKDIDLAMLLGLKLSEQDLKERGVFLHPKSKEAVKYFEELIASRRT